jgi:dihydrofolate reductase
MARVTFDISVSLDGFVAGPNPTLEAPLGEGGERLHEWTIGLASWRESHGREGGTTGVDSDVVAETIAATGAVVMGRRMFSGGEGPWDRDPRSDGWWGDDPPFRVPVFVLTHHRRAPVTKEGGTTYTFVTDGIASALEQARAAAGARDVAVAGGASVVQQSLEAGGIDEFQLHVAPVLLGRGTRLFGDLGEQVELECTRVIGSPGVTHLRYRVVR